MQNSPWSEYTVPQPHLERKCDITGERENAISHMPHVGQLPDAETFRVISIVAEPFSHAFSLSPQPPPSSLTHPTFSPIIRVCSLCCHYNIRRNK